jgi:hypothetical protein
METARNDGAGAATLWTAIKAASPARRKRDLICIVVEVFVERR